MTATIAQQPGLMGRYGAVMAVGILDGSVKKGGDIMIPLTLIPKTK
jgi:ABC-type sugar transport system substrate-binding protein